MSHRCGWSVLICGISSCGHRGVGVKELALTGSQQALDDRAAVLQTPQRSTSHELSDQSGLAFGQGEELGCDGELVERFFGADAAAPYRDLVGTNRTPVLMRPGGSPSGPVDSTWRVVVNAVLEPETLP